MHLTQIAWKNDNRQGAGVTCLRRKEKSFLGCWKEIKEYHNQELLIRSFHLRHDCSFKFAFLKKIFFIYHHKIFSPPSCLHQGSIWSHCLNDEVLRLGLARTAPIVGLPPDSHLYWRLHKRLHRAEVQAEWKGRGLWQQAGLWERWSAAVSDSAFFQMMRRTFKRTWCTKLLKLMLSRLFLLFFFFIFWGNNVLVASVTATLLLLSLGGLQLIHGL